ncbi:hypothetical protein EG329_006580 [Mollisiaceae sp. DMI_Dod_QoI]|nr:hypothetical protein EG329_006580 [Helotiales sp. DMI_Dod_QoI]
MALGTMNTFVAQAEGRRSQHVGRFKPSTELLEGLRGLLVSSSSMSKRQVLNKNKKSQFPYQVDKPQNKWPDSSADFVSLSNIPRSEASDIRSRDVFAVKTNHTPKQSSKRARARRPNPHDLLHLIHPNVINPQDSLLDESSGYALTFTSLATLESLIYQSKRISLEEADSYFKQAILGLEYLHRSGVAHQDLRPENLHITVNGVLKITNFERACYFRHSRSTQPITRRENNASSAEYVAPEVLLESFYDPRPVDMWAVGLIYVEMRRGVLLWIVAAEGADESYDRYLQDRVGLWGYRPIENLTNQHCRKVINSLLDPLPERRYTASRVLKSTWCSSIQLSDSVRNEAP